MSDQQSERPQPGVPRMPTSTQKPTVGRVVLHTPTADKAGANGATEYLALIGQVIDGGHPLKPYCNLYVMPPFGTAYWAGSVQEGEGDNTWHWPPRV